MFNIDLLKGKGLPVRTKPQGVAIFVATFTVPIAAAMLMVGFYVRNEVVISVHKQNATSFENQTQRLADALKLKEKCEKTKADINGCMADMATSINRHMQWTPLLVAIVQNLPDSVALTGLEVKKQTSKRKPAAKGQDAKKGDNTIITRTLKMSVSGNPRYNCDVEVKAFRDRLKADEIMGPKLEDIVIVSQGNEVIDGRDVVTYDIDCVFKPGL